MPINEIKSGLRRAQIAIVDALLTVFGLVCLGYGVFYLAQNSLAAAGTALGTGLVLLFAATIDRFESLKGLGMEAKTRQLDATINKAEVALSQFKELTEIASANIVTLSNKVGRFDAAPTAMESWELAKTVRALLESVGSTEASIRNALRPWVRTTAGDLIRAKLEPAREALKLHENRIEASYSSLPSDQINALVARKMASTEFIRKRTEKVHHWPIDELVSRLVAIIAELPEVTEPEREMLTAGIAPTVEQLSILVTSFDYGDLTFWREFDSRRSR